MTPESMNIGNICGGAVPEVFERELAELLKNVSDPNTDAEKVRSISLEFKFKPLADRSMAVVEFSVKNKLANVETVVGNVFFSKQGGAVRAFTRDPRQTALFAAQPSATPSEQ